MRVGFTGAVDQGDSTPPGCCPAGGQVYRAADAFLHQVDGAISRAERQLPLCSIGCQVDLARRAVQQAGTDLLLQLLDRRRNAGVRQLPRMGGLDETALFGYLHEHGVLIELVHFRSIL